MSVSTVAIAAMIAASPVANPADAQPAVAAQPLQGAIMVIPPRRNTGIPDLHTMLAQAQGEQADESGQAKTDASGTASDSDEPQAIIVTAQPLASKADPVAVVNLATYKAVQALDDAVIAPISQGYEKGIPSPVRSGISNVINNLDEPIVFVNFLLQGKPGEAFHTLGRFVINSTLGLGGLIDVAKRKPFNIPRRSNGLADTLGYYGVGPGPYLFLPLIGATTVRDLFGRVLDLSLVPFAFKRPFNTPAYSLAKGSLSAVTERVANDDRLKELRDQGSDGYLAMREFYLKKREAEIDYLKGKRASPEYDWEDFDPLAAANKAQDDADEAAAKQPGEDSAPAAHEPAPPAEAEEPVTTQVETAPGATPAPPPHALSPA